MVDIEGKERGKKDDRTREGKEGKGNEQKKGARGK